MRGRLFPALALLLLLLPGCSTRYREDLSLATLCACDGAGEEVSVSAVLEGGAETELLTARGGDMAQALERLRWMGQTECLLQQIPYTLVGQELAEKGLEPLMDALLDPNVPGPDWSTRVWIVAGRGEAALEREPPPGPRLAVLAQEVEPASLAQIAAAAGTGREVCVPLVSEELELLGCAVIRDGVMIGWTEEVDK